jgi:hypothetical protein
MLGVLVNRKCFICKKKTHQQLLSNCLVFRVDVSEYTSSFINNIKVTQIITKLNKKVFKSLVEKVDKGVFRQLGETNKIK